MKELKLQLLRHSHGAYLDKYMDTQVFYICICRDTYTLQFTQLCFPWLYICRSLILEGTLGITYGGKMKELRFLLPRVPLLCAHAKS